MSQRIDDELERHYGFGEWREPPAETRQSAITGLTLEGDELPGWEVVRVDRVIVPAARAAYQSIWKRPENDAALLSVDAIEMADAGAARRQLLALLGGFQSPQVERQREPRAGDVSFSVPGLTTIVFARANVVAMIRNAGREVVQVTEAAHDLDQAMVRKSSSQR